MTDVVLVTTPAGLVTVRTKVALRTELRAPAVEEGQSRSEKYWKRLETTQGLGLVSSGLLPYFKTFIRRPLLFFTGLSGHVIVIENFKIKSLKILLTDFTCCL